MKEDIEKDEDFVDRKTSIRTPTVPVYRNY